MSTPSPRPSRKVLKAFGLAGDLVDTTSRDVWRVGNAALKRVGDPAMINWLSDLLTATPSEGRDFRLPRPIAATDGRWTADGWSATTWLPGEPDDSRWHELLHTRDALHEWLGQYPRPLWLDHEDTPWRQADRKAWGEQRSDPPASFRSLIGHLLSLREPISMTNQLVHGDLSGNVLFCDEQPPTVIDFSLYWRPSDYAAAIIAVDCFEWGGAGAEVLHTVASRPDGVQMLIRAALFRAGRAAMQNWFDRDLDKRLATHRRTASAIERLLHP